MNVGTLILLIAGLFFSGIHITCLFLFSDSIRVKTVTAIAALGYLAGAYFMWRIL